jgi:hypothetical protein
VIEEGEREGREREVRETKKEGENNTEILSSSSASSFLSLKFVPVLPETKLFLAEYLSVADRAVSCQCPSDVGCRKIFLQQNKKI